MDDKKEEKKTIWDKIGSIDYRIVYTLFLVLLIIPIIQPIGLPMKVDGFTKRYYNAIKDLSRGSVILVENWVDPKVWDETEPIITATWKILWNIPSEHDIKIIVYSSNTDTKVKMDELFAGKLKPPKWREETYGETWVDLGSILIPFADALPLQENFAYYFVDNTRITPLMDIPVIQEVAARAPPYDILNAYDFDLMLWGTNKCEDIDIYIRQWWISGSLPYHLPMLMMTTKCVYYDSYWIWPIKGHIRGLEGAAELEYLSGFKGEGIKMTDAKALTGIGALILLVLGNIACLGKKPWENEWKEGWIKFKGGLTDLLCEPDIVNIEEGIVKEIESLRRDSAEINSLYGELLDFYRGDLQILNYNIKSFVDSGLKVEQAIHALARKKRMITLESRF